MSKYSPVNNFEDEKKNERNTILLTVFAAVGVNLFASGLVMIIEEKIWGIYLLVGFLLSLGAIILYFRTQLNGLKQNAKIEGFFVYNSEKRELINIPGYEAVVWMFVTQGNSGNDLQTIWKRQPIGTPQRIIDHIERVEMESDALVRELLEYVIIKLLTAHLEDYFKGFEQEELTTLKREDLSDFLSNRFIKWYSEEPKDFKQLCEFSPESFALDELIEKYENANRGTKSFSRFQLVVPESYSISKNGNKIIIKHRFFEFIITINFNGIDADVPELFDKYYLGVEGDYIKNYRFDIEVSTKFNVKSLFSSESRFYYLWIDSFIERLYQFASQEDFLDRIGWNTAETLIRCNEKTKA